MYAATLHPQWPSPPTPRAARKHLRSQITKPPSFGEKSTRLLLANFELHTISIAAPKIEIVGPMFHLSDLIEAALIRGEGQMLKRKSISLLVGPAKFELKGSPRQSIMVWSMFSSSCWVQLKLSSLPQTSFQPSISPIFHESEKASTQASQDIQEGWKNNGLLSIRVSGVKLRSKPTLVWMILWSEISSGRATVNEKLQGAEKVVNAFVRGPSCRAVGSTDMAITTQLSQLSYSVVSWPVPVTNPNPMPSPLQLLPSSVQPMHMSIQGFRIRRAVATQNQELSELHCNQLALVGNSNENMFCRNATFDGNDYTTTDFLAATGRARKPRLKAHCIQLTMDAYPWLLITTCLFKKHDLRSIDKDELMQKMNHSPKPCKPTNIDGPTTQVGWPIMPIAAPLHRECRGSDLHSSNIRSHAFPVVGPSDALPPCWAGTAESSNRLLFAGLSPSTWSCASLTKPTHVYIHLATRKTGKREKDCIMASLKCRQVDEHVSGCSTLTCEMPHALKRCSPWRASSDWSSSWAWSHIDSGDASSQWSTHVWWDSQWSPSHNRGKQTSPLATHRTSKSWTRQGS